MFAFVILFAFCCMLFFVCNNCFGCLVGLYAMKLDYCCNYIRRNLLDKYIGLQNYCLVVADFGLVKFMNFLFKIPEV